MKFWTFWCLSVTPCCYAAASVGSIRSFFFVRTILARNFLLLFWNSTSLYALVYNKLFISCDLLSSLSGIIVLTLFRRCRFWSPWMLVDVTPLTAAVGTASLGLLVGLRCFPTTSLDSCSKFGLRYASPFDSPPHYFTIIVLQFTSASAILLIVVCSLSLLKKRGPPIVRCRRIVGPDRRAFLQ